MRPVILKIKGINSFIDEQIIDFTKLMSYGLFGITGNTGSGKSTILDALILALYDKIPRKSNNYVNASLKSGEVYFEFQINAVESKTYVVERKYTKTEKETTSASYARLYEKKEAEVTVIASKSSQVTKSIEKIIGLNYEDFTRSVVLPQGKFSEFLSLQGRQRNDMLERIFGLERIGDKLQTRIKDSLKETESELTQIEKITAMYGDITEKDIENLSAELKLDEDKYNLLKQKLELATKTLAENKATYEQYTELQSYINKKKTLEQSKKSYEIIESRIADAEKAQELYPYYINLVETESNILKLNSDIQKNNIQKKSVEELIQKALNEYEIKKNEKESLLPKLLELEIKINDSIIQNKELKKFEVERENLLAEYTQNNTALLSAKSEYEKISAFITELEEKLVKVTESVQTSKVSPLIRETVTEYAEYEKSIDKTGKEIQQKEKLIKNYNDEIMVSKRELQYTEVMIGENNEKLVRITETLNKINTCVSGLPQSLMELKQSILESNIKYKKAKETDIRLTNTKKDLEAKLGENKKLTDKIKILSETQLDCSAKLTDTSNNKKELEKSNIAYILAKTLAEGMPCPVCGSKEHPSIAKEVITHAIENIDNEIAALTEKVNSLNTEIYNYQVSSAKIETEIVSLKSSAETLSEEFISILDNITLDEYSKNIKALELEFKTKSNEQKELENQKLECETSINEANKMVSNLNIKKAMLSERIQKDEKAESVLKSEIEILITQHSELLDIFISKKNELGIDSFVKEQKEINSMDKQLQKYEKEEKKIREQIQSANTQKEALQTQTHNYSNELQRIKILGKEKNENIDKLSSKIQEVCQDKAPEAFLKQTKSRKKNLDESFESARQSYELLIKQSETIYTQEIELNKNKQILEGQSKQQNAALENLMSKNNVQDRDFISQKNISKEQKNDLQMQFKKYTDDVKVCSDNVYRLEQKLQGKNAHEINIDELSKEREQISDDLNLSIKNIAVKNEKLTKAKKDIIIVDSYRAKVKTLTKKQNLLAELKSIFIGSKFVEYIADSELQYISKEASQRLRFITRGRYELLYAKHDFYIIDNFNGKTVRGVETLSGGELFLASLALALALSSKIQLKSSPLEFFFLDEGFGALDSHLLDVVVSSLENLKNQQLTVGLITHVDELKNRLPVRLSVIPPNHGIHGTKVSIE